MSINQQETAPTPKTQRDMTFEEAYAIQRNCGCAGCGAPLVAQRTDKKRDRWTVVCGTASCRTPGWVTRRQAERIRRQAAGKQLKTGKPANIILTELGY